MAPCHCVISSRAHAKTEHGYNGYIVHAFENTTCREKCECLKIYEKVILNFH